MTTKATNSSKFVIRIGNNDPTKFGLYLFPVFNLFSFISAFFFDLRAGVMAAVVILMFVLIHKECLSCFRSLPFTLFFATNILSVFAYTFNGRPIAIFLSCITYNIIPMLMYGIGRCTSADEEHNPVYKGIVLSNIFIVIIGFLIYFSPSLAVRVHMDSIVTAGINERGVGYRFGSYLDSLMLGSVCAISIPLLLTYQFSHKYLKYVMLVMFSVALFLTMQRGAWTVGIVSLVGCLFISTVVRKKGIRTFFYYLIGGLLVAYAIYYFISNFMSAGLLEHLRIRIERFNLNTMLSTRSHQTDNGIKVFLQYPFGFGLGAAGNKASPYNMQIVPDGNYIRILVETGIIGIISFAFLNIKSIIYGIKTKRYYSTLILALYMAHAIGSNVFDFYYGSFVYWFVLGYLSIDTTHNNIGVINENSYY